MNLKKKDIDIAINWLITLPTTDKGQEENKNTILKYISFLEENIDFLECFDWLEE